MRQDGPGGSQSGAPPQYSEEDLSGAKAARKVPAPATAAATKGPKKYVYTNSNQSIAESIARMNANNGNNASSSNSSYVTKPSGTSNLNESNQFDSRSVSSNSYGYNNNSYAYAEPQQSQPKAQAPASHLR